MCFRFYGVGWIKGQKLYADYEFLYSRHHKYFSNPEEARAAVELVLSKPERIKDFGRNFAFVGFDEVTGAIYVVKIDPRVKNKANHVRSVFEITAQQYQKYKLEASPVLQLSPTEDKQSAGGKLASRIQTARLVLNPLLRNPSLRLVVRSWEPAYSIIYLKIRIMQAERTITDWNGRLRTGTDGLRFSIAEYSQEEQRDIIDVLKPFTGSIVDKSPEEYAAYLKDKGVEIPADDAFRFAQEAARQKLRQARKAADQRRDNWLYENIMEYRWAVEFAGSSDFKIKVSPRFEKVEKSGTFWHNPK